LCAKYQQKTDPLICPAWNIQLFQGPSENLLEERAEEETTDKVIYGIEGTLIHSNVRMVQEIRLRNMFTFM
jgi:hypothetical protein